MATGSATAHRQFSQPVQQLLTMLIIVGATGAGAYFIYPTVADVVLANIWLNAVIAAVFIVGVISCFWQIFSLSGTVRWIGHFIRDPDTPDRPPRLLASLATQLRGRGRQKHISSTAAQTLLDSVATRIEEARDITRYITNLLIFLGLLGTFWGLATTVPAVVETIQSLRPSENEAGVAIFDRLMSGLESQLGGMGTAFSSSLLGLAGSLVVGLLEIFASHGQNRFYRQLEEWLSTITRVSFAGAESDGSGASGGADIAQLDHVFEQLENAVNALSEQSAGVAEQLGRLSEQMTHAERNRSQSDAQLNALQAAVSKLAEIEEARSRAPQPGQAEPVDLTPQIQAMQAIAQGQEQLIATLQGRGTEEGSDAESRMRLRSIDVQLLRILEEMSAGRQDTVAEIRADLAAVAKLLRQAIRGTPDTPSQGR